MARSIHPGEKTDKTREKRITYTKLLTVENCNTMIKLTKANLKKCETAEMKIILEAKIQKYRKIKSKRMREDAVRSAKDDRPSFTGLYTYDKRENPTYKELYWASENIDQYSED